MIELAYNAIQAGPETLFDPATKPTMYFIGVTTGKSSIMKVFPRWAEYLKLGDAQIKGIDCKVHDDPRTYRRIVEFIRHDPLSRGALVTTHKLDLFNAAADLFDDLDHYARMLGEVSGIAMRREKLVGYAKDPQSSGLALEAILPPGYWETTGAEMLLLGAGGSGTALTLYLMQPGHGTNRPTRIVVSDPNTTRLKELELLCRKQGNEIPVIFHHAATAQDNDAVAGSLKPFSMVINATGLGKDQPGSPLTPAAIFPRQGIAWDFNYRGKLLFLEQARKQANQRVLQIEDGWVYFLHGWQRVIAEVFETQIPTKGAVFDELSALAAAAR
jgi:shikimate 5-dehydrogenase